MVAGNSMILLRNEPKSRLRPTDSGWGLVHSERDLTGNLYMRNRYYDAQAGRFTQEDPIGLAGGLNAYGFAAGDPVSYSDPYGLKADTIIYDSPENADVVGHEFFSHVLPWSGGVYYGSPYMCPDSTSCARDRENTIRGEMKRPPRTW
jgi:RHS repeat-associated protein